MVHHVDSRNLLEEPEDVPRLRGPRRVVIPRDDYDPRALRPGTETGELTKRIGDRRIGRSYGVEDVARDEQEVGTDLGRPAQSFAEGPGNIGLPDVDPHRV